MDSREGLLLCCGMVSSKGLLASRQTGWIKNVINKARKENSLFAFVFAENCLFTLSYAEKWRIIVNTDIIYLPATQDGNESRANV